jgi:hypothetical protein
MMELLKAPMQDDVMALLLLGGFAGLRTIEVARMNWEDVDFKSKQIHVRPEVSKQTTGMLERVVDMTEPLVKRREFFKGKKGQIVTGSMEALFERRRKVALALGWVGFWGLPQFLDRVVSYDKWAAKLTKHSDTLNMLAADRIAYAWSPTENARIFKTTGSTARTAEAPGATGTRKRLIKEDILKVFSLFNREEVPTSDRRLLISPGMFEDLLLIEEFIDMDRLRMRGDLPAGQIGEVLGFKVFMRSKTTRFNGSAGSPAKIEPATAAATTDSYSALFFHPRFVRFAKGTPMVYINPNQGQYLGTTMNASLRSGGMISRLSQKGTAAIVEAVV